MTRMNYEAEATKYEFFEKAQERVWDNPELWEYKDILLDDWPEGDDHYQWVAEAPIKELIDWASLIRWYEDQA